VLFLSCVCVSVSGVLFSVGVSMCVCHLLIFYIRSKRRMTITGTHGYRAPEVYDRDYGKEADWWNVGILIIEMLTATNPFRGETRKESEELTKTKVTICTCVSFR